MAELNNNEKKLKKTLKENKNISVKQNIYDLRAIKKIIGKSHLYNHKKIIPLIENLKVSIGTKANYYKAIFNFIKTKKNLSQKYLDAKELYKQKMWEHNEVYNNRPKPLSNKLKNLNIDNMKNQYLEYIKDKESLEGIELLIGIFILEVVRRLEYHNFMYYESKQESGNYLLKKNDKYYVILNDHKNIKKTGTDEFEIENKKLIEIIKKQNYNDGDEIFNKSKRQLQRDLKKYTEKIFKTSLTVRELRVLFNSKKYGDLKDNIEDLEKDAKKSGHSVKTKLNVYVRK